MTPTAVEACPIQDQPTNLNNLPKQAIEHIFTSLRPRELALAAGVCRAWHDTAALAPWDSYYAECWRPTPATLAAAQAATWQKAFSTRMALARGFRGRPQQDRLFGHTSGVKVARILPDAGLLLTGSVDRRLALWDLESGTQLATSLLHAGTVRCIALDDDLLATGSSDHRIRVWRRADTTSESNPTNNTNAAAVAAEGTTAPPQTTTAPAPAPAPIENFPFDIHGERIVLGGGHTGPVSALELCPTALFSGSWDYCVRVWDRSGLSPSQDDDNDNDTSGTDNGGLLGEGLVPEAGSTTPLLNNNNNHGAGNAWPPLQCIQSLHFDDWVTGMTLRSGRLLVASGNEAHVIDAAGGGGLRKLFSLQCHETPAVVTAVQGTEDGKFLFYSTAADGGVVACDLRAPRDRSLGQQPATIACNSAVTGLSWDHPWLAASLQNGEVLLLNAETVMGGGGGGIGGGGAVPPSSFTTSGGGSSYGGSYYSGAGGGAGGGGGRKGQHQWPSRALASGVPGGAQCVDIQGRWVAAGFEAGVVATWDFGKAQHAEQELEALRRAKRAARNKKKGGIGAGGGGGGRQRRKGGQWTPPLDEEEEHEEGKKDHEQGKSEEGCEGEGIEAFGIAGQSDLELGGDFLGGFGLPPRRDSINTSRAMPMPIPPRLPARQEQEEDLDTSFDPSCSEPLPGRVSLASSPSSAQQGRNLRVPSPISLGRSPVEAEGSRRQSWQVLGGITRQGSKGEVPPPPPSDDKAQ